MSSPELILRGHYESVHMPHVNSWRFRLHFSFHDKIFIVYWFHIKKCLGYFPFKTQWLFHISAAGSTFKNSPLCPHSVFMRNIPIQNKINGVCKRLYLFTTRYGLNTEMKSGLVSEWFRKYFTQFGGGRKRNRKENSTEERRTPDWDLNPDSPKYKT